MSHRTSAERRTSSTVNYAIKTGRMVRPTVCEACGRTPPPTKKGRPGIFLHHHDYSKPLDVIPLCGHCHKCVHGGSIPEPRTGRVYRYCHAAKMKEYAMIGKSIGRSAQWVARREYREALAARAKMAAQEAA